MKKIISLILICILITACNSTNYKTIDANEAMDIINTNDVIIIDVRTSEEYDSEHIDGSINIPVDIIDSVDYDKNATIIVYCASGMRSASAAKTLINMGYTNVYNLDGGLINWGFELVK